MADKVLCEKSDLVAVANAIRSKNGTTVSYKVKITYLGETKEFTYQSVMAQRI